MPLLGATEYLAAVNALGASSHWYIDNPVSGSVVDQVGAVTGTYTVAPQAFGEASIIHDPRGSVLFANASGSKIDFGDVYNFTGTAAFTACVWMRVRAYNSGSGHIIWCNDDAAANGWALALLNPAVSFTLWRGDAAGVETFTTAQYSQAAIEGSVHLIAYGFDGSHVQFGFDGAWTDLGASSKSQTASTGTRLNLTLGAASDGGSGFDGWFQHATIFSSFLSTTDFQNLYNVGMRGLAYQMGTAKHPSRVLRRADYVGGPVG